MFNKALDAPNHPNEGESCPTVITDDVQTPADNSSEDLGGMGDHLIMGIPALLGAGLVARRRTAN